MFICMGESSKVLKCSPWLVFQISVIQGMNTSKAQPRVTFKELEGGIFVAVLVFSIKGT